MEKVTGKGHRLLMEDRLKLSLNGVKKVQSFDPKEIVLETEQGILSIKGEGLGIKQLNLEDGVVEVEGHVDVLNYPRRSSQSGRQSLWGRIFR